MNIYVPGKGNPHAKILICGEAPSYEEERALEPFVGPSGRFLNSLLSSVGINREQCWVTNVCKYLVRPNRKDEHISFEARAKIDGIDLLKQIEELRREVTTIKPNIIIALGNTALNAVTGKKGIQDWRGSLLLGMGSIKTIATYHPAHVLHQEGEVSGYWTKAVMKIDLKRAALEQFSKEIVYPHRTLRVCESSYELENFIKRHAHLKHPAIDIEAFKCIPICIGIAFTPHEGITVPLWNVYGISKMSDSEIARCWRILAEFLAQHDVVGQNFGYDRDKIHRLGFIVRSLHNDTLLSSFAINPELPKNLAFNTSIYTREPFYKNEGMYEGEVRDLLIGCARDSCCTKEIEIAHEKDMKEMGVYDYYRNFLIPLHSVYHYREDWSAIEQNGVRINHDFRKELLRKYIEWDENLSYEMFKLVGHTVNCNSNTKQVPELVYDELKLPRRKGVGEEVLTQLLNHCKTQKQTRALEIILEQRRVKKTIGTYIYAMPDFDGRMRTSYFLCLDTGRSATSKQEAPIRPEIDYKEKGKPKKKLARGIAFQTITKHGDIGADYRKIFVPDDGYIFLQADLSQAEARVIFLLSREDVRMFDEHDLHALTASWFFGGTESDYSKKVLGYESPIRFAGKTLRHAGHLGAGKRRASIEVNTLARKGKIDFRISEKEAERALKIFHNKQPNIRGVFHEDVKAALSKNRRLIAPVPYGIDAEKGGTRIFFEREGDELYRQAFSYIPQRAVSEHTKGAAMRILARAPWIRIMLEAHDALLTMVPIERKQEAGKIIREEMERPLDFSRCTLERGTLIIPTDLEEGMNYKELDKFKWVA